MLEYAVAKQCGTLAGLTYAPNGTDGNVFVDWMPDQPPLAVAVMTQPGEPQLSRLPYDLAGLQLLIRGNPEDARSAKELAALLYSEFTCLDHVVLDAAGPDEVYVVGCTALQSSPVPIGRDELDRPEYSLNFQLHITNPTAHRP